MSVTFSVAAEPTGEYQVKCLSSDRVIAWGRSMSLVRVAAASHKTECSDCNIYGNFVNAVLDVSESFELNVSSMNASLVLARLGIDTLDGDLSGSADASDFLGRVILALESGDDDSGVSDVHEGNLTHCGVPAGYYTERLTTLHEIASEALRLGRRVTWS